MTTIIRSAAYFLLCECKKHGQVVTALGEKGVHSITKRQARDSLLRFVQEGKIASDEILEARRQIIESQLCRQSSELEQNAVDIINGLHGFYDPDYEVAVLELI
jgi:hypothetical protein